MSSLWMKCSPFQASGCLSMAKRLIGAGSDDRVPNAIVYPRLVSVRPIAGRSDPGAGEVSRGIAGE